MPISKTAYGVAYQRYAHLIFDGSPKILEDNIIELMLSVETKENIKADKNRLTQPLYLGLRSNVLVRSRFTEDEMQKDFETGTTCVVVLGAGLDTSSVRLGGIYPTVRFIEVDQHDTQEQKRKILAMSNVEIPDNVNFLSVDFEKDDLKEKLAESGITTAEKVFFSWLGVTMYLTRDAIVKTLSACNDFASGSKVVFTFTNKDFYSEAIEKAAQKAGEVWRSKFSEDEIHSLLREIGFSRSVVVQPEEIHSLYFKDRNDQLKSPRAAFLAIGCTERGVGLPS